MSDTKQALKKDICDYFLAQGCTREMLAKLCQSIKADAETLVKFYELSGGCTESKVAPRHREAVKGFVDRMVAIIEETAYEGMSAGKGFEDEHETGNSAEYYNEKGEPVFIPKGLSFLPQPETAKYLKKHRLHKRG